MTPIPARVRLLPTLAGAAMALAAPLALPVMLGVPGGAACAQVSPVEPYMVVVTSDNVNLRCGAGAPWYPVGQVKTGDVLKVDGHDATGWVRVAYLPGMPALVGANEARVDEAAKSVTLTTRSRLRAFNPAGAASESWRPLLDEDLPADTVLNLLEVMRTPQGGVEAFKVVAPSSARAYVSEKFVRRATTEEMNSPTGTPAMKTMAAPTPVPAQPQGQPAASGNAAPKDTGGKPVVDAGGAGLPRGEPNQPAVQTPPTSTGVPSQPGSGAQPGASAPTGAQPAQAQPAPAAPTTTMGTPPATGAAPAQGEGAGVRPAEPKVARPERGPAPAPQATAADRLAALNASFEKVKKTPIEEAEVGPLIAEYQRLLNETPATGENSRRRAFIQAKIDLLQIRADMQKGLQDVKNVESTAALGAAQIQEKNAALAAKPRYTVVGRLSASTVYDGSRLPLMYRVLSVEGFPGRTVAYVLPGSGVDVAGKIGQLVGIIGEGSTDASLGVPVLRVTRVDALSGAGGTGSATPSGVQPLAPVPAGQPGQPAQPGAAKPQPAAQPVVEPVK